MIQWTLRFIMNVMGYAYVTIERFVKYPEEPVILEIPIDDDLMKMSRMELCNHIGTRFGLEDGAFWQLESTQKIRLGCQLARNYREKHKNQSQIIEVLRQARNVSDD